MLCIGYYRLFRSECGTDYSYLIFVGFYLLLRSATKKEKKEKREKRTKNPMRHSYSC